MADSEPRVGDAGHVHDREALLLVAQPSDAGATAYCRDHLSSGPATDSAPLVVLTDRAGAGERWDFDGRPGVVVAVGERTRSSGAARPEPAPPASSPELVLATGDLGDVGRTVDDYLTTWTAAGHRPVVCVDSLTGLLEHDSVEAGYRFLYVLLHRVEGAGGAVHAHADSRDYEEEILRTFHGLFDRVISFQDGGSPHG